MMMTDDKGEEKYTTVSRVQRKKKREMCDRTWQRSVGDRKNAGGIQKIEGEVGGRGTSLQCVRGKRGKRKGVGHMKACDGGRASRCCRVSRGPR